MNPILANFHKRQKKEKYSKPGGETDRS